MGLFSPATFQTLLNVTKASAWFRNNNCFDPTLSAGDGTIVAAGTGVGRYLEVFKDTALARFDSSSQTAPSNINNLGALASAISQDYFQWKFLSFDVNLAHILNIAQSGLLDQTIWDYNATEALTRIMTYPEEYRLAEFGHFDWTAVCTALSAMPCYYYYGPPILCTNATAGPTGSMMPTSSCTGNQLMFSRYSLCLENGRLVSRFAQYDTFS